MQNLKIRRYKKSDLKEVRNLHILALKSVGAFAESGHWDEDLNNIENVYLKDGEFLVVLSENRIIAMGALKKITDEIAEIKRMRVHPDFQRRGIAQTIYNMLEKKAIELGYKILRLDTTIKQVAAQKLYQKNGFVEVKRGLLYGFETIYYEKKL